MTAQLQSIHAFCEAWKEMQDNKAGIFIKNNHIIAFIEYTPDIYYISDSIEEIQQAWLSMKLKDDEVNSFIYDHMHKFKIHYR